MATSPAEEDPALTRFREYLRIPSVPALEGTPRAYAAIIKFLTRLAEEIGLTYKVVEVAPDHPVMIITWEGTRPELKSILLNSHYDVVPVFPEHWKADPFAAEKRDDGTIVARGSQDMKCVGMWYLEAVRRMKSEGKRLTRTLHMVYVPDEEIGSLLGMELFVQHQEFRNLNIGFALDESIGSETDEYTVFTGERSGWWFTVTCEGSPGHGSRFIENTAVQKVQRVMNRLLEYREQQKKMLTSDPNLSPGEVTSLNITKLDGGVQFNVVPAKMSLGVDIRVSPTEDFDEFEARLQQWVKEAGEGCSIQFYCKNEKRPICSTDPSDPWWGALSTACTKRGMKLAPQVSSCGTDIRYVRGMGIPAYGFMPINNTPILLHDHNEYIREETYLEGIGVYVDVITAVANVLC